MNKQMIRYVLGLVLLIEGALLLLPLAVALLYQETTWKHFGLTIAVCLILGGCVVRFGSPGGGRSFPRTALSSPL